MTAAELDQLIDAYCLGQLSPTDVARLNSHLRDNATAQRRFLEISSLHAHLQREFGSPLVVPTMTAPPARRWTFLRPTIIGGLAAAVLIGFGAWLLRPEPSPVAVLRQTVEARWTIDPGAPGTALPPGRLQLEAGVAEIAFATGAVALVEGPAELDLLGRDAAFLHTGQLVLRGSSTGGGFRLETPTSNLRDVGTEFGVAVAATGESLLQVYEGEVVAELKQPDADRHLIESGQAVRLDPLLTEVPFQPDRFIRVLPSVDDPRGRGKYPYNKPRFDTVHIVPAPGPIRIDADLNDWDLSGRFHTACEPPYDEHHYLEAAMMYDREFLYVSAHVGDPFPMRSVISPRTPHRVYGMGGGVALRVSTDRKAGWPVPGVGRGTEFPRPEHMIDRNDKLAFLMLWYHRPTGEACLHAHYGMDMHGAVVNPNGYRGAYRLDADGHGYTLEYAISWSLLNAADDPPRAGDTLGAMWLTHWSDPTGRIWKGQLIDVANPRESGWNFDRAATWGKAVYHPRGMLPPETIMPLNELP